MKIIQSENITKHIIKMEHKSLEEGETLKIDRLHQIVTNVIKQNSANVSHFKLLQCELAFTHNNKNKSFLQP